MGGDYVAGLECGVAGDGGGEGAGGVEGGEESGRKLPGGRAGGMRGVGGGVAGGGGALDGEAVGWRMRGGGEGGEAGLGGELALVTLEGAAEEGEVLGLVDEEDGAVAMGAGHEEGYAAEVERPCAAVEAEGDGGGGGGVAEGVEVDDGGYLEGFGGEVVFALGEVPRS